MKQTAIENKKIDLKETTTLLGVSSATVRNWIKHNYLTPTDNERMRFDYVQVVELQNKIANGQIDRLGKRANKRHSQNTFIPEEYADSKEVVNFVQKIIDDYETNQLNKNGVLFSIILNLLKRKGLVDYSNNLQVLNAKNDYITNELNWWKHKALSEYDYQNYRELLKIEIPTVSDVLGLIHQSLAAEGNKAQSGSYYTPKNIVDEIISEYVQKTSLLLDPCCGTGQFLLSGADVIQDPANVWGFDIDEIAVRIARINLFLKYPEQKFSPNVYHKNTLLDLNENDLFMDIRVPKFDVVATNPPWGVHLSNTETIALQSLYPEIKSNETFSYFLKKGIGLLKDGGILSYVLPEAVLNVKTHKDIRGYILENTQINKAKYFSRCFKNVFTPVIRLDITKKIPLGDEKIIAENGGTHLVNQSRLKDNSDYIFDVFNNSDDISIFDKVFSVENTTLKDKAEWALGIVTGNNKLHLSETKKDGYEPILTGKDIKRFSALRPKNFIKYQPDDFQQVAPEHKYRAKEKLIYKFISKELVFSYDNKQTLTLNSANILIPKVENYPIKTILALFNSSLYQYLYQKKFGSIKILRNDLEKLPLPIVEKSIHNIIKENVDKLLDSKVSEAERKKYYIRLDKIIMDLFHLTEEEQKHIGKNVKLSDKLLNIK